MIAMSTCPLCEKCFPKKLRSLGSYQKYCSPRCSRLATKAMFQFSENNINKTPRGIKNQVLAIQRGEK